MVDISLPDSPSASLPQSSKRASAAAVRIHSIQGGKHARLVAETPRPPRLVLRRAQDEALINHRCPIGLILSLSKDEAVLTSAGRRGDFPTPNAPNALNPQHGENDFPTPPDPGALCPCPGAREVLGDVRNSRSPGRLPAWRRSGGETVSPAKQANRHWETGEIPPPGREAKRTAAQLPPGSEKPEGPGPFGRSRHAEPVADWEPRPLMARAIW